MRSEEGAERMRPAYRVLCIGIHVGDALAPREQPRLLGGRRRCKERGAPEGIVLSRRGAECEDARQACGLPSAPLLIVQDALVPIRRWCGIYPPQLLCLLSVAMIATERSHENEVRARLPSLSHILHQPLFEELSSAALLKRASQYHDKTSFSSYHICHLALPT